jgi:hypothetical protein
VAEITKEDIAEIRKFNRNVEWLKRTNGTLSKTESVARPDTEWMSVAEAIRYIKRSRSWLQRITVKHPGDAANSSMMLIKGLDWKRVTNRIYYKRLSLETVKKGMEMAGDHYDNRLSGLSEKMG